MTPSGLSIGIILKINFSLKSKASYSSESKKSIIPCERKDALDSPGCTLEEIKMILLCFFSCTSY